MYFTVKWLENQSDKDFKVFFEEDETLPKELLSKHLRCLSATVEPTEVSVYGALLYTEDEVSAGCLFMHFPQSSAVLIRHIFIKEAYRKEFDLDGIDPAYAKLKYLFSNKPTHPSDKADQDGLYYLLTRIRARIGDENLPIFVFGETINVLQTQHLSLEEHKRLNKLHRFYATIQGKTFETDQYDRPRVKYEFKGQPLALINFPEFHGQPFAISIPIVMAFVEEYRQFIALDGKIDEPITDWSETALIANVASLPRKASAEDLQRMSERLGDLYIKDKKLEPFLLGLVKEKYVEDLPFIYMRELPRLEEPKIGYKRASVCFELMVDEDYYEPTTIREDQRFFKLNDEPPEELGGWESFRKRINGYREDIWEKITGQENAPLETASKMSREEKIIKILQDGYCIIHHSFETDLLAYKYQALPPFFTKNYLPGQLITVQFPDSSNFISEGRKEQFYTWPVGDKQEKKMNCFVNYSYFLNSRMRVWHIVLRSVEEDPTSEFDIIRLMKFFSGSQESTSEIAKKKELEQIKFKIEKEKRPGEEEEGFHNFLDFFKRVSGVIYRKDPEVSENKDIEEDLTLLKNIKTGIVQLDSKYLELNTLVTELKNSTLTVDIQKEVFENQSTEVSPLRLESDLVAYHANLYKQFSDRSGEAEQNDPLQAIKYILKTYCGIALGLFDFERMGVQEVGDTLQPRIESLDKAYFLTVNRGVITSYSIDDDVLNSTWKTLGINPYLVIPSAVLVHNEYVSTDADNRLTKALERCRMDSANSIELSELIEERNYIDDLVNDDILSNVFQYPSEQELYEYGMKHRGINERIKDTKAKLEQLDKIIEQVQSQRSIKNERRIQTGLGALSVLQIASFFADFGGIKEIYGNDSTYLQVFISFIITVSIIGLVLMSLSKPKVKVKKARKNGKQSNKK